MWSALKAEVGWSEVAAVTRRVGQGLVEEIESLEAEHEALMSIFADYQVRNDERVAQLEGRSSFAQLQSPARDLLERNLAMLLENIRDCCDAQGAHGAAAARTARDAELLAYLAARETPTPSRSASGLRPSTDFELDEPAPSSIVRPSSAPLRVRGGATDDELRVVRSAVQLTDRYVGSASREERDATARRVRVALERELKRLAREVERAQSALEEEHDFVQKKSAEASARPPTMTELRELATHLEREWVRLDALTHATRGAAGALSVRPHRALKAAATTRAEREGQQTHARGAPPQQQQQPRSGGAVEAAAVPSRGGRRRGLASRIRGEITESRYMF
jgi:hypothetical protein